MDLEKLTDRARGFLQAAQTIAVREHHQRIAPAHLLKALLDDEQGMAAGLIQTAGGDPKAAKREVDALVAKIPAVTGSGATQAPALDGDTIRVLDQAEQIAQKAGDEGTAMAALEIIEEERAMANVVEQHWDRFAELSLHEEGVTV